MAIIGFKPDKKKQLTKIRREVVKINRRLLEAGMDLNQIMEFWEECQAEAQIQHNLPPCRCKDVNQCDTWCRAKARFVLYPPDE